MELRNMANLLKELEEYGYETIEETEKTLTLTRSQYLDNGYGYYFTSDITLEYNKETEDITEIWIDDYTEKQIDELLQKETVECLYMKQYDCCIEEINYNCETCTKYLVCAREGDFKKRNQKYFSEICFDHELNELNQNCDDCTYLTMIWCLMQSLNDGNW